VSERLRVREIDDDEGQRLVRIVRQGSGSVVTWRRAQMVLLSAQARGIQAAEYVALCLTLPGTPGAVVTWFSAGSGRSLHLRPVPG
jgi:hypothetical protein